MDNEKIKRIINGGRAAWEAGRTAAPIVANLAFTPPTLPMPPHPAPTTPAQSVVASQEPDLIEKAKGLAKHRQRQLEDEQRRAAELWYQLREPEIRNERERE